MTLVETLIAIGVGSIAMLALASLTMYSARSFSAMVNYTDLNQDSRMALDRVSKDIRQSKGLIERTPTSLAFRLDGTNELSYAYDAKTETVTENGKTVLENCTFWTNEIFQQSPIGNFSFAPTEIPSLCKMVQIKWLCSSETGSAQTNSADVQSMKVVIRKAN